MKVYLAGPMTGYPEHNFPEFTRVAAQIRAMGYEVISPHERDIDYSWSWEKHLAADIRLLLDCEGIALLPCWEKSKGARLEAHIAKALNFPTVYLDPVNQAGR